MGRPPADNTKCKICGLSFDKVAPYTVRGVVHTICLICRNVDKKRYYAAKKQKEAQKKLVDINIDLLSWLKKDKLFGLSRSGNVVDRSFITLTQDAIVVSNGYEVFVLEVDVANIARWLANQLLRVTTQKAINPLPIPPRPRRNIKSILDPEINPLMARRYLDYGLAKTLKFIKGQT